MIPATDFSGDPALPGLAAIRTDGLSGAVPALRPDDGSFDFLMWRGYTRGARATLEARLGPRRLAVKVYAEEPALEASLYAALADGLAGDSRVCVPRVVANASDLKLLVLGWLEGPTLRELLMSEQGERTGRLAGRWLQTSATLTVRIGSAIGSGWMLEQSRQWAATLDSADRGLGGSAAAVVGLLEQRQPADGTPHLVHGNFCTRHVLDAGGDVGLIDWSEFGQGPLEIDAGRFLASLRRTALGHRSQAEAAMHAERAFLAETAGLLDAGPLAWYQAAALLSVTVDSLARRTGDWLSLAHTLLGEAKRGLA
jgi:aminoglycoside phosphotransferase (APT) family kinase protein